MTTENNSITKIEENELLGRLLDENPNGIEGINLKNWMVAERENYSTHDARTGTFKTGRYIIPTPIEIRGGSNKNLRIVIFRRGLDKREWTYVTESYEGEERGWVLNQTDGCVENEHLTKLRTRQAVLDDIAHRINRLKEYRQREAVAAATTDHEEDITNHTAERLSGIPSWQYRGLTGTIYHEECTYPGKEYTRTVLAFQIELDGDLRVEFRGYELFRGPGRNEDGGLETEEREHGWIHIHTKHSWTEAAEVRVERPFYASTLGAISINHGSGGFKNGSDFDYARERIAALQLALQIGNHVSARTGYKPRGEEA